MAPLAGIENFPLRPGTSWSYKVRFKVRPKVGDDDDAQPGTSVIQRMDVVSEEPQRVNGAPAAVLEWRINGNLTQREFFVVAPGDANTGPKVRCVRRIQGAAETIQSLPIEPSQSVIQTKLVEGTKWDWVGKVGKTQGTQVFEVGKTIKVEALDGKTYQATQVTITATFEDGSSSVAKRWFAKGVGVVKEEVTIQTANAVFEMSGILQSFKPAGL